MKSILNSLGSNYSKQLILLSLKNIIFSDKKNLEILKKYFADTYNGDAHLFYKGRDAIQYAFTVMIPESSKVLTQAFSCYAVEEGITRAGMKPVYVDIDSNTTNLSVATLEKAFAQNKDARAVLVQHSLGISADMIIINKWCKKNNLLLIEDLAQGVGGVNTDKSILGKYSDAVVFSFGRDKILDAVSGGAVVFKNVSIQEDEIKRVPFKHVFTDLVYPLITFFIRRNQHTLVGKIIFQVFKKLGLLTSPTISKTDSLTKLHSGYASLVLFQILHLEEQIAHRRKIAGIYFNGLKTNRLKINGLKIKGSEFLITEEEILRSSNLRFSLKVKDVNKVIKHLKENKIYLSDRWYRKAVDCGSFACKSVYKQKSCKNAEELAEGIINLPTHQNISVLDAERIVKVILKLS